MPQHQTTVKKDAETAPQFAFNKAEVYLHTAFIIFHLYVVTKMVIDFSTAHPQPDAAESYLTVVIGKERDAHDVQWETYRANLPVLAACMAGWYWFSRLIERYQNEKSWLLGSLILGYSFRSDYLIYLAILSLWYCFTHIFFRRRYFVLSCWAICIVMLYVNELTSHLEFLSVLVGDVMPEWMGSSARQISCGQVLNMTFLKLISFAMDKHRGSEARELQKHLQKCQECTDKEYCLKGRNLIDTQDFSFKSYMNYVLFAPTLLTGPPLSYKNFISFRLMPTSKRPEIARCIFVLICFQLFQHYCPVIPLTSQQSFVQAEVFALFHLVFIWFKFLIIWRVARVWAGLCGVEVVDNLSRCVCNNYGFEGFWRMWHRGFNQWLVRYLYIPLDGNRNLLSVVATIAFVAFWHDHSLNIVIWAFALVIFILPEILIKRYARKSLKVYFPLWWFKYLAALLSAIYIYCLVFSNIVGFGYGADKLYLLWDRIRQEWAELLWSLLVVSSAVILMFYQRAMEGGDKNF